jgi:diadenosine tetraphosphatase ApaH/serine/threonine PP2A family protein phosphatase
MVGYGTNPCECIDILRKLKAVSVAGNHEWGVLGKMDIADFNPAARQSILWTRPQIRPTQLRFLKNLPLEFSNRDLVIVHGTLHEPQCFHYRYTSGETTEDFNRIKHKICFVGHTHIPGIWGLVKSKPKHFDALSAVLDLRYKYIVDVGSVGQPRDGNAKAAFCIYDTQLRKVEIKRVIYPFQETQEKILTAGLAPELALRLSIGF